MPRSLVVGNGNILVGLDRYAEVRDFYFPFVGLENHVGGHHLHKVGVWVDNRLHWLDDGTWDITIDYEKESLVGHTEAVNHDLKVTLFMNDLVYNEKNIFLRKITVRNDSDRKRVVKLFLHQQFEIYQSHPSDSAYFDPRRHAIIHYKGRRVFLVNLKKGEQSFDDWSIGLFEIEGRRSTHQDAEDGRLSKNPVEYGRVDSVVAMSLELEPSKKDSLYYWIAVAESIEEAQVLNDYVIEKTPEHLLRTTHDFWQAWVNKKNFSFHGLNQKVVDLFKKSLLLIRVHVGENGSIIASGDSDLLQYGRDTYGYVWPRDAAYSAMALNKAGDFNVARRFFEFSNDVVSEEGYFMHKYRPDKALGSSWHPWIRDGKPELPIQEDETAIVIYALWQYYEQSKDVEFIETLYNSLIKKAADFMKRYTDPKTGLPLPSYDLWEEKYGTSTYSTALTYAALLSAARFAKLLGKTDAEEEYTGAAIKMKEGIIKHLWNQKDQMFYKLVNVVNGEMAPERTLDISSIYGIFKFGVLEPHDEKVKAAIKTVESRLRSPTAVGGIARYADDKYYRVAEGVPGNPWFITSLWLAQYYAMAAATEKDLEPVKGWLEWVATHALPSGVLSELVDPFSGKQLSAAPLIWSHAEFVTTVIEYLEKLEKLGVCKACIPVS